MISTQQHCELALTRSFKIITLSSSIPPISLCFLPPNSSNCRHLYRLPPEKPPQTQKNHLKPRKTQMAEIPEDIILNEILPWLPAKTLLRFKCVSRRWNAFISTTHFTKTHFQRPSYRSSRSVITIDFAEPRLESVDYGVLDKMGIQSNNIFDGFGYAFSDYSHLIGSSNGLVFLIFADDIDGVNDVEDIPYNFYYIIYNPCLGLVAFIKIKDQFRNHFVIDNDFVKYNFSFGFAYVNSFDDYRIVAIGLPSNPRRPNIVVCVYSLRDNQWRTPRKFKQHRLPLRFLQVWWRLIGAMVNDTLHWGITVGPVGRDRKCIAAFDLVKDEFKMMPLPYPELGDGEKIGSRISLCNMNDCLCAWGRYDDASVELWMLKEYGVRDSWTYLFRFNLDQDLDLCTRDLFGLTESGKLLIFTNMDGLVFADFSCDPPKYVKLDLVDKFQAANYVQSLESPIALFANPRE